MTDYKNLKKLTLVMLSLERQLFVTRSMEYWSKKNVNLLVFDGSKKPIQSAILNKFTKYKNIYYEHCKSSYAQRLLKAKSLVKSKYVALIGDDEFFIPSAVERCINELDKNNELVSCIGTAVSFYPLNGAVYGKPKYPKLLGYEISHNDPRERVKTHMRDYMPSLVYAITRTHQWKIAVSAYTDEEFPVYAMVELQIEMILSFSGKSKVIPYLMWMRSSNESKRNIYKEKSFNPKNVLPEWWKNKKIKIDHERFINIVSDKFSMLVQGYKNEYYKNSVIEACNSYVDFFLERKIKRKVGLVRKLARFLTRFIHDERKRKIKNFFFGITGMPELQHNLLLDEVMGMQKKSETVDLIEVQKIIRIISDFHNNKSSE